MQVEIRIIATSIDEARAAIDALRRAHGDRFRVTRPPRTGRRGQVLAYGTLEVELTKEQADVK